MANISIHDLEMSETLDVEARTTIRGGAFGIFGFIVPFEAIGASRRSAGGNVFNVLNIFADQIVFNEITNTSVLDVDITEVIDSSVTVEAPQVQLGSAQNTFGGLTIESPL